MARRTMSPCKQRLNPPCPCPRRTGCCWPHGQEAALTSQAAPSGPKSPCPKQALHKSRAKTPEGGQSKPVVRLLGPRGPGQTQVSPRPATCFRGHADHALLLLPEADVVFKRQEIKKQLEDDRTAMSPHAVG